MASIYLIRHGQASFKGPVYDLLSELGQRQSVELGKALAEELPRPFVAYSGEMQRHRQTASAALKAMDASPDYALDAGWNEFDHERVIRAYGDEGRIAEHGFQKFFEQAVARWMSGEHDGDYAESWHAFRDRVRAALKRVALGLPNDADALVFTSGGPISTIVADQLLIPQTEWIHTNRIPVNCGITKLIVGKRGLHLSTLNGHAHFEHDPSLITYR
jgi:broad specificity phosphatase PhoE